MATVIANPPGPQANVAGPLIRRNVLEEERKERIKRFLVLLPAFGISFILHAGLFGIFVFLFGEDSPFTQTSLEGKTELVLKEQKKDEVVVLPEENEPKVVEEPLSVQDIDPAALDPDMDLKIDAPREAEVIVPGTVNPDNPVGIEGGNMTAPPLDIHLPKGLGGPGQGGGLDIEGLEGFGGPGQVGGYNLGGAEIGADAFGGPRASGSKKAAEDKAKAIKLGGGSDASEAAVVKGLKWLKKVQSPTGAWKMDGPFLGQGNPNDIAGTAFGLLPFLGAGFHHLPETDANGNLKMDKEGYRKCVLAGLSFLVQKQNPGTGEFTKDMYSHALATYALCEAYGMSGDPKLLGPAQKAVNFLLYAQHEGGGWRYGPKQAGDLSVSGWCIQAMKAAKMAKLYVPDKSWYGAIKFLDQCHHSSDGYSYVPDSGPSYTMSAVGLLGRYFLQNWGPNNLSFIKGIQNHINPVKPGQIKNMYYYYYATQVMYQFGGKDWKAWNEKMRDLLIKTQQGDGSWAPVGAHAEVGGRLMETSLSILTLEVYYRYLPTYMKEKGFRQDSLSAN